MSNRGVAVVDCSRVWGHSKQSCEAQKIYVSLNPPMICSESTTKILHSQTVSQKRPTCIKVPTTSLVILPLRNTCFSSRKRTSLSSSTAHMELPRCVAATSSAITAIKHAGNQHSALNIEVTENIETRSARCQRD